MLLEVDYPDIDTQKAEHASFQELLTELLMDAVEAPPDADKITKFLEDWWIEHILNSDMQYKAYFERPVAS